MKITTVLLFVGIHRFRNVLLVFRFVVLDATLPGVDGTQAGGPMADRLTGALPS
jgi:hypothetical protein